MVVINLELVLLDALEFCAFHPRNATLNLLSSSRETSSISLFILSVILCLKLILVKLSSDKQEHPLIRALIEEWDKLPQQLLDNVVQTRATIDLLKDTFGDRLISRFGPVNWPPRSCDLTPLDYFLWGYVKSLVYADKPQTLDHLEDNIRRVIADIRLQMLEKVIENWTSRLDYIRASRGSPMPEIIFKM
ncbi:transposable element Tc3 transposase [Trichonephila clavipes]|nr:transposable element Tc3 transposase [Trichonephila clavipes]